MTTSKKNPHSGMGEALPETASPLPYTISPDPKGLALQNAFGKAVATPTEKRGFVTPKFYGGPLRPSMVYGRGGSYPQGHSHGFTRVFNHHAHPLRVKTQRVVLKSRKGA
jgi:hypothetical protein